jgi:hypothetical protein
MRTKSICIEASENNWESLHPIWDVSFFQPSSRQKLIYKNENRKRNSRRQNYTTLR